MKYPQNRFYSLEKISAPIVVPESAISLSPSPTQKVSYT
jgi:hypothetical protein